MSTTIPNATPLEQFHAEGPTWSGMVTNADGSPADLTATGCTLTFTLAASPGGTAILTKTLGSGIVGDSLGGYTLTIPQTDIDSQAQTARLQYDIVYVETTGAQPQTVLWGNYTIKPSVGG